MGVERRLNRCRIEVESDCDHRLRHDSIRTRGQYPLLVNECVLVFVFSPPPSQNYANELQEQLTLKTFSGNTIGVSSTFLPYLIHRILV